MIRSLKFESFRGVAKGELTELPRIALLTGPNGSGKSTVLEALQIGAGWHPSDAVGRVVVRRMEVANGVRWLCHKGDPSGRPKFWVAWESDENRYTKLSPQDDGVHGKVTRGEQPALAFSTSFTRAGRYTASPVHWQGTPPPEVRFLDQRIGSPRSSLHHSYSEARRRNGAEHAVAILRQMDPEIRGLEILTEGDAPMLHLAYEGRTVPAGLAGDGVESLVRLALELSMRDRGTVLIEEPEAHQHSRAIAQSAKILVAAARTGCQVILTTHSMELLDDLLAELTDDEHSWLAVYRTRLDQGQLRVMRVKGEDVSAVRAGIGDDLR